MKPEKIEKICDKVIEYGFYLLLFLVPLIMTPWNFELFEFNKMMLTYGLTVIIVGAWLAKMVLEKKILFKRSPFDAPLIIYLSSQLLSTLFSIDRHTSLWGYYSRFHGGLLSTISYLLLYFAFVSNFDKQKTLNAVRCILGAATLVAAYGILEHFGIDAKYWVQDVKNRVFSTLGQPNWLSAWLAALLPVSLALALGNTKQETRDTKKYVSRIAYCVLPVLFLLCLLFTKSRSGIPAALLSLAFFFFLLALPKILTLKKKFLALAIALFVLIFLIAGIWGTKTLFPNAFQDIPYILGLTDKVEIPLHEVYQPGSESGDIRKVVWRGAIKIWKNYPLFGSGVETFAYSYYNFRPVEHNFVSEWDFLYNKAHNEYLNFLATTGAVGLGSYLLLIGWIIWWNFKHLKSSAFFAGWTSILITNFFGFSVVPVALLFFLYPAFAFVLTQEEQSAKNIVHKERKETLNWSQKTLIIFCLLSSVFCLLKLAQFWYADVLYARGNRLNKQGLFDQAFNTLQGAVSLNSSEPLYHDELSWSSANLAVLAAEQEEVEVSNQLVQISLSESDKALKISPRHLNFLKTRAKIYYRLYSLDPSSLQPALQILLQASNLAPTDAKIFYNLGLVYYQLGQKQEAVETLQKTLKLKPNYQEAKTALDLILKEKS